MEGQDKYICDGIKSGTIKLCPFCGTPSELASGCNYVTCFCKQGFNKKSEWCWKCHLPKYQPSSNASSKDTTLKCCNDKTHNSH